MTKPDDDEISLLDLLIVVAENWLLLVIAPLVIGALTYWFLASQPQTYSSEAVVALPPAAIVEFVEAGVQGGSLAPQFGLSEPDMVGLAVEPVSDRAGPSPVPGAGGSATVQIPNLVQSRLTLIQTDRVDAEALDRLVQSLQTAVQDGQLADPKLELSGRADRLEGTLAIRDSAIEQLTEILSDPAQMPADADIYASSAIALDQMLSGRSADEFELAALREALAVTGDDIVVDAPSAPRAQGRSPVLISILAVLGSGFVLLILVFVRAGLRHAASEQGNQLKLERIKNAMLLRRNR